MSEPKYELYEDQFHGESRDQERLLDSTTDDISEALERYLRSGKINAIGVLQEDGTYEDLTRDEIANELRELVSDLTEAKDQAYLERNHLVAALARLYPSGIRPTQIEGWNPEWQGCVYIDLPDNQQISYHYHDSQAELFEDLPAYTKPYNGHEKDAVHRALNSLWRYPQLVSMTDLLQYLTRERRKATTGMGMDIIETMERHFLQHSINRVRGLPGDTQI